MDASTNLPKNQFEVGFVAHSENHDFIVVSNRVLNGSLSAIDAEMCGIKEALSWIMSKGWSFVIVETDLQESALVLQNQRYEGASYNRLLVCDCKSLI